MNAIIMAAWTSGSTCRILKTVAESYIFAVESAVFLYFQLFFLNFGLFLTNLPIFLKDMPTDDVDVEKEYRLIPIDSL